MKENSVIKSKTFEIKKEMITEGDFKMETWEGLVNSNVSCTVASSVTLTDGMSPMKLFSVLLKKIS